MFYNYGIILMIAIFSLLSAVEIDFIKTKKYFFWKWSFYFCVNLWMRARGEPREEIQG